MAQTATLTNYEEANCAPSDSGDETCADVSPQICCRGAEGALYESAGVSPKNVVTGWASQDQKICAISIGASNTGCFSSDINNILGSTWTDVSSKRRGEGPVTCKGSVQPDSISIRHDTMRYSIEIGSPEHELWKRLETSGEKRALILRNATRITDY